MKLIQLRCIIVIFKCDLRLNTNFMRPLFATQVRSFFSNYLQELPCVNADLVTRKNSNRCISLNANFFQDKARLRSLVLFENSCIAVRKIAKYFQHRFL